MSLKLSEITRRNFLKVSGKAGIGFFTYSLVSPPELMAFSLFSKRPLSKDFSNFKEQTSNWSKEDWKRFAKEAEKYRKEDWNEIVGAMKGFLDRYEERGVVNINVVIGYEQEYCRNTPACFTYVNAGSTGYDNSTIELPGGPFYQDLHVSWTRATTVNDDDIKAGLGAVRFSDKAIIEMLIKSNVGRMRREKTLDLDIANVIVPPQVAYTILAKQLIDNPELARKLNDGREFHGYKTKFTEQNTLGSIIYKLSSIDNKRGRFFVESYVQLVFDPIGTPEHVPKDRQTTSYN